MKTVVILFGLMLSVPSLAESPTGWTGPIREAGRPWLNGTPYQPSRPVTSTHQQAQSAWQWDGARAQYWVYDANTGIVWLYNPSTCEYSHYYAQR
jgi:hypothetical protein